MCLERTDDKNNPSAVTAFPSHRAQAYKNTLNHENEYYTEFYFTLYNADYLLTMNSFYVSCVVHRLIMFIVH